MSQALSRLFHSLNADELAAFARYEQGRADDLQAKAAKAQREADAARKELKRRETKNKQEQSHGCPRKVTA